MNLDPYHDRSSQDLWVLFRARRDERAFRELVRRFDRCVLFRCRVFVRDEWLAEDVRQEVWLAWFLHCDRQLDFGRAVTWLLATADNMAKNAARKERNWARRNRAAASETAEARTEAAAAEHDDAIQAVHAALVDLSVRQREALELVYFTGMEQAEVAALLGCSTGTVSNHVARGLERLRTKLATTGLAIGGVAAIGSALRASAVPSPVARVDILVSTVLGRVDAMPALPLWVWLPGRKMVGMVVAAAAGVGGLAAWCMMPGSAICVPDPPNGPLPLYAAESYQARTVRLFHAKVEPQLVATMARMTVGNGSVEVRSVSAYDTRLEVEVWAWHRPDGVSPFASEFVFIYDTSDEGVRVAFALAAGGRRKDLNLDKPLTLWRNELFQTEMVVRSAPLRDACDAFRAIRPDHRTAEEGVARRLAAQDALRPYLGEWLQRGDPASVCRIEYDLESGNMGLRRPSGRSHTVFYGDLTVRSDGSIRPLDWQLTADGRRLDFGDGDGEWWIRPEPTTQR